MSDIDEELPEPATRSRTQAVLVVAVIALVAAALVWRVATEKAGTSRAAAPSTQSSPSIGIIGPIERGAPLGPVSTPDLRVLREYFPSLRRAVQSVRMSPGTSRITDETIRILAGRARIVLLIHRNRYGVPDRSDAQKRAADEYLYVIRSQPGYIVEVEATRPKTDAHPTLTRLRHLAGDRRLRFVS